MCDALLGYAVINGVCQEVYGCDPFGFQFFESEQSCEDSCGCGEIECESNPCSSTECLSFPESNCVPDFCSCSASFSVGDLDVTAFCDKCANLTDPVSVFGDECDDVLGYAVVNGMCQPVQGCNSLGYEFFSSFEECRGECLCIDVDDPASVFGSCAGALGVAVVNGVCQPVAGCSASGVPLFGSVFECESKCGCPGKSRREMLVVGVLGATGVGDT